MNLNVNGHNVFLIVFVTFITSAILVPLARKCAIHTNALDYPNARKVQKEPMPRMGGLAIFFSFLLGYMLFARPTYQMISIFIGGFILIVMGLIDDINSVKAVPKFLTQIIAACVVIFYGHMVIDHVDILGLNIVFPTPINYLITLFFIVGATNAINLIDGLDGLSSGVASIYFATISIIAFILNRMEGLDTILSLITLGATLGFLVHNFYPAKIYIGDAGSYFLGFIISIIAILGYKGATLTSLIIPIVILAIPIFDTALAILRRLLKGQGIMDADKEHFHHQLLKLNFSVPVTVLIIYGINILFASVSIFFVLGDKKIAMGVYLVLMILLLYLVLNTDILFLHDKDKKNKKSRKKA